MKQLLKSAYIWNQTSKEFSKEPQDILIENGFIKAIKKEISDVEAKEINYPNLHVSPAWFDPFVSFGEPGFEERETLSNGSLTALKNGFSGIGLCPNTNPILSHKSDIDFIKRFETDLEISPIGALTKNFEGNELTDLFDMSRAGAVAFYDFKKSVPNANVLKVALQYVKAFEGLIINFPEDKSLTGKAQVHEDEVTIHL
ncbi:MAG: dihydroorotase, partial [Psychroflexus sp.]